MALPKPKPTREPIKIRIDAIEEAGKMADKPQSKIDRPVPAARPTTEEIIIELGIEKICPFWETGLIIPQLGQ
ncbi:MAG: hypothetical protein GY757_54650 [bacterium]|nr:hypothetical protein [bacterium]